MPHLIDREQALKKISNALPGGECLACWLLQSNAKYILHKGLHTTVLLTEFPRTWGQTMVVLNTHKVSVSETTTNEWLEFMINVKLATTAIENALKPLRCYVASLGSTKNLHHTCPHLHFNIQPIYNETDRPEEIFTWKNGLYDGSKAEWGNLVAALKQEWNNERI
jgi:diadenosine tetraphosphate (Ap4A) HIT family hydrolase